MNKLKDKGLSYIEVIIVLAIASILVGLVSISVGLISRSNVHKGADNLELAFAKARSVSLAKGSSAGTLNIINKDGLYYYYIGAGNGGKKKVFLKKPCSIQLYKSSSDDFVSFNSGSILVITYEPSTGKMSNNKDIDKIYINNGKSTATLELVNATGKVIVK